MNHESLVINSNPDIDIKLGPVTKLDKTNKRMSQNLVMMKYQKL